MIYNNLLEIADNFDTFFFDAWGVFNIGGTVSQSAIATMAELVSRGKSVSIMSNTPRPAAGMIRNYAKHGLAQGIHYHNTFSSGQCCYEAAMVGRLPVPGKKYYIAWDNSESGLLSPDYYMLSDSEYIKISDINDADFVFCDFPSHDGALFSDEKLMEPELSRVIAAGKPVICANPDLDVYFGGEFVFTQGTPCKIFEQHGISVIYYGKPYPDIYTNAMQKVGDVDPARTVMIGDTLHTDILGATRAGIKSCLTLARGITENNFITAGLEINEKNLHDAATAIGARIDYIIRKVPTGEL